MAQPRFQFIRGVRRDGDPESGGVGWRLLGPNNRELGRSVLSYADADAALSSIVQARQMVNGGEDHIVQDAVSGLWAWHLGTSTNPIAKSGRGFRHERDCRYNLHQFRAAAPTAPAIHDGEIPPQPAWRSLVPAAGTEVIL